MHLLKICISLIFGIGIITCLKAIVPILDENVDSVGNEVKEIELGEINPSHIGAYSFGVGSDYVIIDHAYPNPSSIRCVFSNGTDITTVISIELGANPVTILRGEIRMIMLIDQIKIFGPLSQDDGMFCILSSTSASPVSFNLFYMSTQFITARNIYLSNKKRFASVRCNFVEMDVGTTCVRSVESSASIQVGEQTFYTQLVKFELMHDKILVGEESQDLVWQLRNSMKLTNSNNVSLTYSTEKKRGRETITQKLIESGTSAQLGPIGLFSGKLSFSVTIELKYQVHLKFASLTISWGVYERGICGKTKQYTCTNGKCVHNIRRCLLHGK